MCPLFHFVVWHPHLKVQFASSDRNTLSAYLGSYPFVFFLSFPFFRSLFLSFSRLFFVPSLFLVCLCLLRPVLRVVGFVEAWVAANLLHRSLAGGLDRPCNWQGEERRGEGGGGAQKIP